MITSISVREIFYELIDFYDLSYILQMGWSNMPLSYVKDIVIP